MKYFKVIFGLVLLPTLTALLILDRIILVFLPHVKGYTIQESLKSMQLFNQVFIRTTAVLAAFLIYLIIEQL